MASAPRTVAVIGAGPAGLAAAWRLSRAGCAVTVLERSARPGGRAGSSAPVLWSAADHRLLALLHEAGLAGASLPLRPWERARPIARGSAPGGLVPAGAVEPRAVARLPGVRWIEALRLVRLARLGRRYADRLDAAAPERAAPLDDRCLRDFGELYFGPTVVRRCLAPWLGEVAPADPDGVSRVAFLLRWRALGGLAVGAPNGDPSAPWRRIAGAVETRLEHAAEAVESVEGAGDRLRVRWRRGASAESADFDAAVLALPAAETVRLAGALLVDAERRDLSAVPTDPALRWTAHARRLPVALPTWVVPPGEPVLATAALEPGSGDAVGRVSAVTRPDWAAGRLDSPDDALEKEVAAAVERLLGVRAHGGVVERHAGGFPRFDVGRYRSLERLRRIQRDRRRAGRRLYLAGDHWIAPTVEGAVVSGERAAAEVLADLAAPRPRA